MLPHEQAYPPANVQFKGSRGSFQVYADGSVEFSPSHSRACCGSGPITLSGADTIGASKVGNENAFLVYHCPKNKKGIRKLQKVGKFKCEDDFKCEELILQIRQGASSREELQAYGKKILAVINPSSGKGRSEDTFLHLQTMLHAAGIASDGLISTHPGHVVNAVASHDLSPYVAMMVIGGDGTVHEVLQGLRRHLQMPVSLQIPICHVPCGSGNGIAATLGVWNEETAIHAIVKGHLRSMDAATVRRASESKPLLAVLSVQYGLLADLDCGTEHLRKILGGERFTYGAVREILKWNKYRIRVAYCTNAAHTVSTSQTTNGTLKCPLLDDVSDSGCCFAKPQEWPSGWHVSELDDVRYFNIAGPDWAALDAHINPWGKVDDGLWELAMDKCKSRVDGLRMILQTQAGEHEHSPLFECVRAGAYIIDPIDTETYMTVDGEKVNLEKLSIEVHRKLLMFVCAGPAR